MPPTLVGWSPCFCSGDVSGWNDLIYFDRPLNANPDLPARIASNWPLTPVDPTSMYGATGKDCTHYPTCRSQATDAAAPLETGALFTFSPLRKISMYRPSTIPYQEHRGFSRTFTPGHLSLGLFFPLEAFDGDTPSMLNQVALAKRAEELGFCALWFRDVPLRDPGFGDVGQVFDPWVYLGYIAAHTSEITLGTASIAIPLHHPLHTAKASASIDQLSAGRLILGVASGDRPVEFSAFGVDAERRGDIFREYYEVIRRAHSTSFEPIRWSGGELRGADLIPKPTTQVIPMLVTGHSRQSLDWIARESTGWINYPRQPNMQRLIVEDWRLEVMKQCGSVYKPFAQSLYIDLAENPSTPPTRIHLGFRLGRDHLRGLLEVLQEIGVDHVILNLKYSKRPAAQVIEELGTHIVPQFGVQPRSEAN